LGLGSASIHSTIATRGWRTAGKTLYRKGQWLYDHYIDVTMNGLLKSEWNELPQAKGA